jgi:aspartate/methionine/tyrosine aminotransferase
LDCLNSLITPRTRLLCLCNPHNPLGRVFSRQELTAFGEIALQHNLLVMSDEVWADIVYPPHRHISLASLSPEIAARTLTIFGTSKSFAIAGLRVGFLVVPQPILEQAKKISLAIGIPFGVTTLSQLVAMTAYQRCGYWLKAFCQHLQEQRDYAVARLNQVPGVSCNTPQGTYVLFPDVSTFGLSSQQVTDLLLEHGVAVVPGTPQYFGPGAEGHIRIAFSTSREILRQGLDRIQKGCNTLQSNKGKDK